jgi:outer membrane lipoprotein-sorting protein
MRFKIPIVLAVLVRATAYSATAGSLDDVLARMDRAAPVFKGFSANLTSVTHTAVIDEDETEKGRILLKRGKRDMEMLVEFAEPNSKSVAVHDRKAEIYYPKQRTIEEYDIGQYQALLDQFMLIGFGTSGKELAASYDMKVLGNESVAGTSTTHLELMPKSAEVRKNLKKLELWIPESDAYPVQQKIYLAAGDYRLFTYTNVKMNPPLSDADLRFRVPKDTKRVSPQR